jgi:hypothetical protein
MRLRFAFVRECSVLPDTDYAVAGVAAIEYS